MGRKIVSCTMFAIRCIRELGSSGPWKQSVGYPGVFIISWWSGKEFGAERFRKLFKTESLARRKVEFCEARMIKRTKYNFQVSIVAI